MRTPHSRSGARFRWLVAVVGLAAVVAFLFWPESTPEVGEPVAQPAVEAEPGAAAGHAELYTCSMHPQVLSEEPGNCPICGMRLVPVKVEGAGEAPPASGAAGDRKIKYWRAPMDPSYVSDRPGKSPMGMDLVPVYEGEAESGPVVSISPVVVQNMGIRTAPADRMRLVRTIRTVGRLDYDETLVRDVTTKFDGWIEELYADYTGQYVERGAPLFRVYSRELYSTQEEYLLALENRDAVQADVLPEAARDMRDLIESARLRLELFDVSDEQIRELARRGKPTKTLTILSPHAGVIVDKNAREGMHITPGTKLYTIADLSRVWVYVDIFENEVPFVKLGQDAVMELSYLPGQVFHGKVIYVYPFVDTETRTVKVRLEFANPHLELKPGMFADVRIETDLGKEGLVVPRSAVIDTGRRQVAFVALGAGRFEPREVTLGVHLGGDEIEVLQGLRDGEQVVVSGQFLLDSESKLREAVLKMIGRQRLGPAETALADAGAPADVPMPDHEAHEVPGMPQAEHPVPAARAGADLPPPLAVPPSSVPQLGAEAESVVDAYLALHGALARDATRRFREMAGELESPLARLSTAAAAAEAPAARAVAAFAEDAQAVIRRMREASPDAVRVLFIELSNDVIGIVRSVGPRNVDRDLHAFYCPMAGAHWIQEAAEPANPYYGFSMLRCGDPVVLATERGEDPG